MHMHTSQTCSPAVSCSVVEPRAFFTLSSCRSPSAHGKILDWKYLHHQNTEWEKHTYDVCKSAGGKQLPYRAIVQGSGIKDIKISIRARIYVNKTPPVIHVVFECVSDKLYAYQYLACARSLKQSLCTSHRLHRHIILDFPVINHRWRLHACFQESAVALRHACFTKAVVIRLQFWEHPSLSQSCNARNAPRIMLSAVSEIEKTG